MTSQAPLGRPPHPDRLTPAEWRVAEGVRHGLTNRDIAGRMSVSVDAVKFHVSNVLGKLGLKDRRALRTWDGVRAESPLNAQNPLTSDPRLTALGQVARVVGDVEVAAAWYRDVLGLQHLYTFGSMAFFDCGGVRLLLAQDGATAPIFYFRVESIHAARDALEARGATFLNAPHLIHTHADGSEEWMAFFKDNEGRPLAIMSIIPPRTD